MGMKWSGLPPSAGFWSKRNGQMEPVFGGFLRVWRNGGKSAAPSCVRARARGLRPSADEQLARAKSFTAKNAAYLRKKGIPINRASLYASHFFGPVTAAQVIGADVNARADLIAGAAATRANPTILQGKTVGQFLSWLHGKTGEWAR